MKPRVAAILVAVVLPVVALAVVVVRHDSSTHRPGRLPIAAGGTGAPTTVVEARADAARYPYGGIVYRAAADLAALTGSAAAYKVAGGADGTKLADALGLTVTPDADGTYTDGDAQL